MEPVKVLLVLLALLSSKSTWVTGTIEIRDSVIFNKISEITVTRSHWRVSVVLDLHAYDNITNEFVAGLNEAARLINNAEVRFAAQESTKIYATHFQDLGKEVAFLYATRRNMRDLFTEYKTLKRSKRAIIPGVGQLLSFMFGTVSSEDLEDIRENINILQENQETVTHVVEKTLSVLNASQLEVSQNRDRLNALYRTMKQIDEQLIQIDNEERQLETFLNLYLQIKNLLENVKGLLREIEEIFQNFKLQINFLAQGSLNPIIIKPYQLKKILLQIKKRLPPTLYLPADTHSELMEYYKFLKCSATLMDNKIIVLIPIPLLDTNGKFDIFMANSLPVPSKLNPSSTDKNSVGTMVAEFELESTAIAVNTARTKYALLDMETVKQCARPITGWCEMKTATFPMNVAQFCITGIFMNNQPRIQHTCTTIVKPRAIFPQAIHIATGIWAIVTVENLTFTITCQSNSVKGPKTLLISPPIGIIDLQKSCSASNDFMTLNAYFGPESKFYVEQDILGSLSKLNLSKSKIWEPLQEEHGPIETIEFPPELERIKQINMGQLIDSLHSQKKLKEMQKLVPTWVYYVAGITVLITIILIFKYRKIIHNKLIELSRKNGQSVKLHEKDAAAGVPMIEMAPRRTEQRNTGEELTGQMSATSNLYPGLQMSVNK